MYFQGKLCLLKKDLASRKFSYFKQLQVCSTNEDCTSALPTSLPRMSTVLDKLVEQFEQRFASLNLQRSTFAFVSSPLQLASYCEDIESLKWIFSDDFDEQLLNLRERDVWCHKFENLSFDLETLSKQKEQLISERKWKELSALQLKEALVFSVWQELPGSLAALTRAAMALLTIFGSTYRCEQAFSHVNFIKSKNRSRLNKISLEATLKLKLSPILAGPVAVIILLLASYM